jgi:uncharacterized protein YdeI (YjbR/CyaY-like superfamily)
VADPDPILFPTAAAFGDWLADHHATASEVWVVVVKKHARTDEPTWEELVPEALRFGWIDSVSRRLDDDRRIQRFSPRRSVRWSKLNVRLVGELQAAGRMHAAGLTAFEQRDPAQDYATGDRPEQLPPEQDARLRADAAASAYWDTLPPGYRKSCVFWVSDAKRDATREKRLGELIDHCRRGERLKQFTSPAPRPPGS